MPQLMVRNLGKAYRRYSRKRGRLLEWLGAPPQHELRWALRDVSFDVGPGESVGIIGANGAGKSTLLKLIAGTTKPTTGTVQLNGTVSALLELGIGFHPDFTGRENVLMAGSIRGLSPERVLALLPEIEAFAEIGDYLDEPVRTYSSGMQVRLAFAISTAVRPDILIVDEALSVGDIYFQQKCFDRIREFQRQGTTLFFVSHSLAAVYSLCSRAMLVDQGRVTVDATPKEAIDLYQARVVAASHGAGCAPIVVENVVPAAAPATAVEDAKTPGTEPAASQPSCATTPSLPAGSYFSEGVTIDAVTLLDDAGRATEVFLGDQETTIQIAGTFDRAMEDPHFGFQVRDRTGQAIFMTTTHGLGLTVGPVRPGEKRTVRFHFRMLLAPGEYTITAGIANRGRFDGSFEQSLVRRQNAASFIVAEAGGFAKWAGLVNLKPTAQVMARGT